MPRAYQETLPQSTDSGPQPRPMITPGTWSSGDQREFLSSLAGPEMPFGCGTPTRRIQPVSNGSRAQPSSPVGDTRALREDDAVASAKGKNETDLPQAPESLPLLPNHLEAADVQTGKNAFCPYLGERQVSWRMVLWFYMINT